MMRKTKILILFALLSFLFVTKYSAQNLLLEKKISEIDSIMYAHQGNKAIPIIDSLLKKKLPFDTELYLKAFKIEALVQINKPGSALNLSNDILKNPNLKGIPLIRTYIERALIYELAQEIKESIRALDFVRDYYLNSKIVKDELYGEYLYRLSSIYRAQGLNEKGLEYAEKAIEFGRKNHYNNVEATGLLLLGVMKPSTINEAIILRKKTMALWKKNSNYIHISSLSYAIARYYYDLNKNQISKKYLDSSFYFAKKTGDSQNNFMLSEGHQLKGNLLEKEGNLKEAINHYKLSKEYVTKYSFSQLEQQISEANAKYNFDKEAIKNEALEQNLTIEKEKKNYLLIGLIILGALLCSLSYLAFRISQKRKEIKKQSILINDKNTELIDALDQNKLLLKELNHRVNNNLALILSLVKFQYYEIDEPKYKDKFQSLEHRIKTIAAAHEQLLYSKESIEGEEYDVEEYLSKITNALIEISTKNIQLNLDAKNINLNIDTMLPIGILINELMSNSLKHAVSKDVLIIDIQITFQKSNIAIIYKDSGTTFKETTNTKSLGVSIINSMVKQLRGTIKRKNSEYKISLQLKNS